MNVSVYGCIERFLKRHPVEGRVLEVGSLDVNGSIRPLFADERRFDSYVGVDIRDGKGVDIVAPGSSLPFPPKSFDCIVSTETLEHDDRFWLSVQEFYRVLSPGGYVLLTTCGNGYPQHRHPHDYWRFMPGALDMLFKSAGFWVVESWGADSQAVGRLGPNIVARKHEG